MHPFDAIQGVETERCEMCEDHPYFPGEPPPEDFFLLFMMIAAGAFILGGVLWVVARVLPPLVKASRISFKTAIAFMIIGVPFIVPFFLRSTGDWPALRNTIKAHEATLRQYQLAHPGWTTEQIVKGFINEVPGPWEFRFSDHFSQSGLLQSQRVAR